MASSCRQQYTQSSSTVTVSSLSLIITILILDFVQVVSEVQLAASRPYRSPLGVLYFCQRRHGRFVRQISRLRCLVQIDLSHRCNCSSRVCRLEVQAQQRQGKLYRRKSRHESEPQGHTADSLADAHRNAQ